MSNKIRNYLGIALIVSVIVIAFAGWSFARAYGDSIEPSSFRSFTVSGEGKVTAVPDVATFSFHVITQGGKDIVKLQQENTKKASEAIAFVKEQGVSDKDLKTEAYNVEPRYQYSNCSMPYDASGRPVTCPPPEIVGYTITQTIGVKVRDFSKIGTIFSGVVEKGANSVSQLYFTMDDPASVQNEARAKAITQARAKAQTIADAAGFGIGRLLDVNENGVSPVYYRSEMSAKDSALGLGGGPSISPAPAIEPGSQDVTAYVVLRYEIR